MKFSKGYIETYAGLPELLEEKYPELNFKNHCYLRMALDHMFNTKWDLRIARPAHKHLNIQQKEEVVCILRSYYKNKGLILDQNEHSIIVRKICRKKQLKLSL
ncbi:hypothetical protein [Croceivirga thetidis]|uniref:Acetyltransferase n=1 Tax=Croceivirga thetidis TaxID=2721623 RepID=A0ABX1GNA9_9FLAO|nr:hypothetical protein [Croceivirga thetidis]NKI31054.1 hypothetical protein [Croceivirga thetidis]